MLTAARFVARQYMWHVTCAHITHINQIDLKINIVDIVDAIDIYKCSQSNHSCLMISSLSTPLCIETDRFRSSYRVERGLSRPDSHHPPWPKATSISGENAGAPGLRGSALTSGDAHLKRRGTGVVRAGTETGLVLWTAVARAQEASAWVEDDLFARSPRYIEMMRYTLVCISVE